MIAKAICNYDLRLGGFVNGNHLTTCFVDTVLTPLPTWLLLLSLPLLCINYRSKTISSTTSPFVPFTLIPRIFSIIYSGLISATAAMEILEIVRLSLSKSGVGLLFINLIGTIVAYGLASSRRKDVLDSKKVGIVLSLYWGLSWIFQSVKVSTLIYVENLDKSNNYLGPTNYLDSDKSLDNYVILGLFVVLFLYEVYYLVRPRQLANKIESNGEVDSTVVMTGV